MTRPYPRRRISALNPTQWLYLVVHALVFSVGVGLYQVRGALAFAVSTSLIATGIAGWVVFFWVRQNDYSARTMQSVQELGLTQAFTARSVSIRYEYEPRFTRSREQISIMGFGLRALREDFGDQFPRWARGTRVRILLLDPAAPASGCAYADQRDLEENNPVGNIRKDVETLLSMTTAIRREFPESFQIRLYRCIPSINICIIDDEAFWGPYLLGLQSRNTMTFLCRRGGHMYSALAAHFEQVWGNAAMSRDVTQDGP